MLKIRMSRGGAKKRPFYKIVIADSRKPRDGRFIEKVGFFNPLLPKEKKERLNLDIERIKYWLSQGAQPSDRVARFLGEANVIPMPKQKNNPIKAKPKKKAQERLAAAEEAKKLQKKLKKPKLKNLQNSLKQKNLKQKLLQQRKLKLKLLQLKHQRQSQHHLRRKKKRRKNNQSVFS
jgi:small subunit ribosomal protein S16